MSNRRRCPRGLCAGQQRLTGWPLWICLTLALGAAPWGQMIAGSARAQIEPLGLVLPTDNEAIFSDRPEDFYMFVHRSFEGQAPRPWSGGMYGNVRTPRRFPGGVSYSRFHEGIDIRPVRRDARGEPLDEVRSIADGRVVYVNAAAGGSSYGRYVVVRHDWGYGPFYSLYAHLNRIDTEVGREVAGGDRLATLGYTGVGIDRERAHLHLELNLFLSERYDEWHRLRLNSPNRHGAYNGINLVGIDIGALYHEHRANPKVALPGFVSRMEPYWRVRAPRRGELELLRRYPWLGRSMDRVDAAASWELTFSRSGVPLRIEPVEQSSRGPELVWVRESAVPHAWNTRDRLTGTGARASLSASGLNYVRLVTGDF